MDISVIVSTFFNSYSQQSRVVLPGTIIKTIEGQYVKFSYAVQMFKILPLHLRHRL
jgi:hypothetical protein